MEKTNISSSLIVSPLKRLLVSIADLLILLILGIITFATIGTTIIGALPSFNEKLNTFNSASDSCLAMYYDSHLGVKNGSTTLTTDQIAYYAIKNYANDKYYENEKLLDNILYFYSDYSLNTNLTKDTLPISKTIEWVNINLYKFEDAEYASLWDTTSDKTKPLKLHSNAKSLILDYINDVKTETTIACYTKFETLYLNALENGQKDLVNCDQYLVHMNICQSLYPELLQYYSVTAIINYLVLYIILFILIPVFSSGGQTLMKRLFKISLYDEKTEMPLSKKKKLLRSLFGIFFYFPVIPFFAIPAITSSFIYMPLFVINGNSVSLFYFVIGFLVISVISSILMFIDKKHRQLHDIVTKTIALKTNEISKNNLIIDEYEERLKERKD